MGGIGMKERKEPLYPEEEMMIEQKAIEAFLEVADYGESGIAHFRNKFEALVKRMAEYENE